MRNLRSWLMSLALLALVALAGVVAAAEVNYPARPVEMIIPQAAGGGFDLTARALASVGHDYFGQPVIVHIRPGAGTILGTREVIRARADGHTLLYAGNHALALSKFQEVPFDPVEDLIPVAQLFDWQWWLVVPPDSPFDTLEELVSYARENPGELVIGNPGSLTIAHVPVFQLERYAGIQVTHLPFDGGGPLNQAVASGQVPAGHAVTPWAVPAIQQGVVKALAVTGRERHPEVPHVPTYRELGLPIDTTLWAGIYAPKGTPDAVIARLQTIIEALIQDTTYRQLIDRQGDIIKYLNPQEFDAKIREFDRELTEIAASLREAGVID